MKANNFSKLISLMVATSAVLLFIGHNTKAELQPECSEWQPTPPRKLIIQGAYSYFLSFSENGKYLAIASLINGSYRPSNIVIWDMLNRRIRSKILFPCAVDSIDFSLKNDLILIGGNTDCTIGCSQECINGTIHKGCSHCCRGCVSLYKLSNGKLIISKFEQLGAEPDHGHPARFADFGKVIISGSGSKTVWNTKTGAKIREFHCGTDGAYACPFDISPNQKEIVIGFSNGTVKIWDINTSKLKTSISAYKNAGTWTAIFSADGKMIATWNLDTNDGSLDEDQLLKIFDVSNGKTMHSYRCYDCEFHLFSPDSRTIALGSADEATHPRIRLIDIQTGNILREIITNQEMVKFSPDGEFLITRDDSSIKFWKVSSGEEKYSLDILSTGDWVFSSDTGYFDASPGAQGKIKFRIKETDYPASEYWDKYHRPGMFTRVMAGQEN